jgi:hypothetical protein
MAHQKNYHTQCKMMHKRNAPHVVMISILAFLVHCFEASCPHLCPSFTTMNFLQICDKNQSFWDEWRRLISFLPSVTNNSLPRLCEGRLYWLELRGGVWFWLDYLLHPTLWKLTKSHIEKTCTQIITLLFFKLFITLFIGE